jgi:hypothetical protein
MFKMMFLDWMNYCRFAGWCERSDDTVIIAEYLRYVRKVDGFYGFLNEDDALLGKFSTPKEAVWALEDYGRHLGDCLPGHMKFGKLVDNILATLDLLCNYCGGNIMTAIGICEDCGGNNDDWEGDCNE